MGNQKSLTTSEVTIDRMLSQYLWNSPIPPRQENMANSVSAVPRAARFSQPTLSGRFEEYSILKGYCSKRFFQTAFID